ncbi:MAG: hypothetical protein JGK37_12605 [Microcoleus sp. PH2017_06_SFM_O_A]|nr:hypothetical protein [Microcoleus sp. PH2017_06_SFM_O_A]
MLRILTFVRAVGYTSLHLFHGSLQCWYESTRKQALQLHHVKQNALNLRGGEGEMGRWGDAFGQRN